MKGEEAQMEVGTYRGNEEAEGSTMSNRVMEETGLQTAGSSNG